MRASPKFTRLKCCCIAGRRFLVINGSSEEVQLAEILIHQTIANQPHLETLVLTVPGFSVGTIIGHGGESVRDIQYSSRCKVDVERTTGKE